MLLGVEEPVEGDRVYEEAARIAESYIEEEDYTTEISYDDVDTDDLKNDLIDAVDDLELAVDRKGRSVLMKASGAVTGSLGGAVVVAGNPLGFIPIAIGAGQYLAGSQQDRYTSSVEEIETKAFLQDMMKDGLEVEDTGDAYNVSFDYLEE